MSNSIKIVIVDDHKLITASLKHLIEGEDNLEVVGTFENGRDFIESLPALSVDVAIVDFRMPVMDGFETANYLRSLYPQIKVICLTMHTAPNYVRMMMQAGAKAFLTKNCDISTIKMALTTVMSGGFYYNQAITSEILSEKFEPKEPLPIPIGADFFTTREKEILLLICDGLTNKEISERLYISARTVDGHREKLLQKTKGKNTAGLVMFAVKNGLV